MRPVNINFWWCIAAYLATPIAVGVVFGLIAGLGAGIGTANKTGNYGEIVTTSLGMSFLFAYVSFLFLGIPGVIIGLFAYFLGKKTDAFFWRIGVTLFGFFVLLFCPPENFPSLILAAMGLISIFTTSTILLYFQKRKQERAMRKLHPN